eukprot:6543707-Alexandrium_andersonii.AAC.1
MDGWPSRGGIWYANGTTDTLPPASFLRHLAKIKDANIDNLPVLSLHQPLEPDLRHGKEELRREGDALPG